MDEHESSKHKEVLKCNCKSCNFEAETQKDLDIHEWVTHINNYRCDKCDFAADSADTIVKHKKSMHYFKCEKCEYEVNNIEDMDVHKKTHHAHSQQIGLKT